MNGIWSERNVEGKKAWQLAENDECGNNDAEKIRQVRYKCRSLSMLLWELPSRDSGSAHQAGLKCKYRFSTTARSPNPGALARVLVTNHGNISGWLMQR